MSSKINREQTLLLFLSKNENYVTAKKLADVLGTSRKTVYRLIKQINDKYSEDSLIISVRGRGYKLDYENYINYQKTNNSYNKVKFSPSERRKRIMEELLLSSPNPIKIRKLFNSYYVGDSVVFNDEKIMDGKLRKYNLILERKNRTLAILGEEANIRKAIKDIIEIFNTIDINDLKNNKELNFNKYDVLFILDQLRNIEKNLDIIIPYPYNVNIFSHIYILLNRSRKIPYLLFSDEISDEEICNMKKNHILYSVAKTVINNIKNYLNHSLSDSETYFLYQYLVSSRMQGSFANTNKFSSEVIKVTNLYIKEMSIKLGIYIDNESIFVDLANHIKPMLNRLKHKIKIKNNLLDEIKISYEEIFLDIEEVSELVSKKFDLPAINNYENGFIALYFARMTETTYHQLPIKVIIMCTSGIGTSELLKTKVTTKFPELEIIDVIASRNIKMFTEKYSDVELILSTIHIEDNIPIDYLLVSAMFTDDDQKRLERKIEEIYYER